MRASRSNPIPSATAPDRASRPCARRMVAAAVRKSPARPIVSPRQLLEGDPSVH